MVELGLEAEDAEGDLVGESGVAGVESGGEGEQEIGGVAAGFDSAEDVEGDAAGG
jgi:hypothetical protein